jgi:hypothetical protein
MRFELALGPTASICPELNLGEVVCPLVVFEQLVAANLPSNCLR